MIEALELFGTISNKRRLIFLQIYMASVYVCMCLKTKPLKWNIDGVSEREREVLRHPLHRVPQPSRNSSPTFCLHNTSTTKRFASGGFLICFITCLALVLCRFWFATIVVLWRSSMPYQWYLWYVPMVQIFFNLHFVKMKLLSGILLRIIVMVMIIHCLSKRPIKLAFPGQHSCLAGCQEALFDISIWHIDCRYIDTFEKYRYRYGHFWKYRYWYRYR